MSEALHLRLAARLKRDGWLLLTLAFVVVLCVALGAAERVPAGQTEEEARLSRVLSAMEGAGQVEAAVFYAPAAQGEAAVPCGAVIVADGAADVAVRIRLAQAASTLLGVEADRIDVFKREGGKGS